MANKQPEFPLILREHVPAPSQKRLNKEKMSGLYKGPIVRDQYSMETPMGWKVPVWVQDEYECQRTLNDGVTHRWEVDDMYNCIAHAMGTFDRNRRTGYLIDMDVGLWDTLNDPGLAKVIMQPGGKLREDPKPDDVLVFWEAAITPSTYGGHADRKVCHAVKLVHPVFANGVLQPETDVSTKNGRDVPKNQTIGDMLKENPEYDKKTWALYRLVQPTVIP